jgi:hypothetical protein
MGQEFKNGEAREQIAYLNGELIGIKGDIKEIKDDIKEIRDNDIKHIYYWVLGLAGGIISASILLIINLFVK